jgi:hypothetical protein
MRGADKAPLLLTVKAASAIMHDSVFYRWMKAGADAFRLTAFRKISGDVGASIGRKRESCDVA